ncbi:SDR family NAD(P)-dependent oxidoreductase [Pseudomonas nitroreducens]|uniref:SDR family NAD(P)-dependent oxidoreductase n=2 Tax=Pseudomonas nitroreducens TaxID=46680 RepID=UPI002F2B3F8A
MPLMPITASSLGAPASSCCLASFSMAAGPTLWPARRWGERHIARGPAATQQKKWHRAFERQVVWITGASSGIGEALAGLLLQQGARVILSGRREAALQAVAEQAPQRSLVLPFESAPGRSGQTATGGRQLGSRQGRRSAVHRLSWRQARRDRLHRSLVRRG